MPKKSKTILGIPVSVIVFTFFCVLVIGFLFLGVKYSFDKVGYAAGLERYTADLEAGTECYPSCVDECTLGCYEYYGGEQRCIDFCGPWCEKRCIEIENLEP